MTTLPQFPGIPANKTPEAAPAAGRVYSRYQQAIFDCLTLGSGNVVIEAVAGSGKTTTIVETFKRWQAAGNTGRAIFLCFNKSIAETLASRVPAGVETKTLHSASYGAIRRAFPKLGKVDEHKLDDHARDLVQKKFPTYPPTAHRTIILDLCRSYGLLKGTMTDLTSPEAIIETLAEYSVELEDANTASTLLGDLDKVMREDKTRVTFDEMLSFVTDHDVPMPKYTLIALDESQDLNKLQIAIVGKMLAANGRLFSVGDSRQSCYGFRGADSAAMDRIRDAFRVPANNQLPLSITYRCPKAVVRYAQQFVAHIEAADSAPEGSVVERQGTLKAFTQTLMELEPGNMVCCRANAPLVSCALKLIANHRRARIKGRDIGKAIGKLAKDLLKKASDQDVTTLARLAEEYCRKQSEKLRAARKDRQADQVEDKCETLLAVIDGAHSIQEVEDRLETLFSDNADRGAVMFSSIHRAKGLEAETVVWLGPEISDWILDKCKTDAARQQEENLKYICITRAQHTLIVQPLPPRKGEE